jgi:hypothetical protein
VSRGSPPPQGCPPVVLVHGLGVSNHYMVPTLKWLTAYYHLVYAPELPSFAAWTGAEHALGDRPGLGGGIVAEPGHADAALLREGATPAGELRRTPLGRSSHTLIRAKLQGRSTRFACLHLPGSVFGEERADLQLRCSRKLRDSWTTSPTRSGRFAKSHGVHSRFPRQLYSTKRRATSWAGVRRHPLARCGKKSESRDSREDRAHRIRSSPSGRP